MEVDGVEYELKELHRLEGHSDRVWCVAWNPALGPAGKPTMFASCSGDKTVRIWEQSLSSSSWDCKEVLEFHEGTVRSCTWSPRGNVLATASFDGITAIWERKNVGGDFQWVTHLEDEEGHESEVKCVSWSPSGYWLATCGRDKSVQIWAVLLANEFECFKIFKGHTQDVKMVKWHPTMDLLFSCSYDNTVKIWAKEDDENNYWYHFQTLSGANGGHSSTVWALSFNAGGDKMVTCSDDLTLKIWGMDHKKMSPGDDFAPWSLLSTLSGYHARTIYSVDWSREGFIASGAGDDAICLFVESNNGSVDGPSYKMILRKDKAHDMDVNSVQWAPGESRLLASASDDGTVKIWELQTRQKMINNIPT